MRQFTTVRILKYDMDIIKDLLLVTAEDINLTKSASSLSYPVVIDGVICKNVLIKLNLTESWLNKELVNLGVKNADEIFFATVNEKNEFHATLKSFVQNNKDLPPIYN